MKNTHEHHPLNMLQQKRKSLIESNLMKTGLEAKSSDFMEQNARLLDDYFHESFEKSMVGPKMGISRNPYSIIALGGYGRQEQCVHSDVDILFLFEKSIPEEAEGLIREIIYPLWDTGMIVGHATRTVEECIELAESDIEVLTSLLDARFVCGMSFLYSKLAERLQKKLILKQPDKLASMLIERNRERHKYFGDSSYLLEPNLKEGQGGLRDYHTLLWIARIKADVKQPRDLEYYGCLSHDEFQSMSESLSFIWYVRNHLHLLAGRKYDQLHFEHQEKLADKLNFKKHNGQQPVELFLGKLHEKMDFIKQQHNIFLYELENARKKRRRLKGKSGTQGIEVVKEMLEFTSSEAIVGNPELLIKIFRESARMQLPLSVEAKRLVRHFLYLADEEFRTSPSVLKSFEQILMLPAPEFNALNEMLNTGILEKFIPEFKEIVNRIQYDEYHLYPVDKHLLHTVRTIKKFGTVEDPTRDILCGEIYTELGAERKKRLLWAALLHDIGKGVSDGSHSEKGAEMARRILAEKDYAVEDIETVSFLVQEHLLLIKTATRRDIRDEETAVFCARKIKDIERLKMLYLLTVADSMSTGPKAWNDWTSVLLSSFFFNILNVLEKGELATVEAVEIVEEKKDGVRSVSKIPPQELEPLFGVMPPRYLLYTKAKAIAEHVGLYRKLGSADFVWEISKSYDSDTRTVAICAKDRPGLFSKIAGVFTLNSINILDAQIYTWKNNIALDVFKVNPPPDQVFEDEKWERAGKHLEAALSGQLDLDAELSRKISDYGFEKPKTGEKPHRVIVDNKSSGFFTIIEVFTHDFPGLLFSVTNALFRCNLDVWVAKIATNIDQVVDVFYVRDFQGQKADSPEQEAAVRSAIEKVLDVRGQR
jgi:[protein-PII] uridylyltransferase